MQFDTLLGSAGSDESKVHREIDAAPLALQGENMQQTTMPSTSQSTSPVVNRPTLYEKCLGIAWAGVILAALASCGSGAVSSPTDKIAATPLSVSPPSANLFPDIPTTFTVSGGTPAYSAFSSNSVVLPVAATVNGTIFTVTAKPVTADTDVDITVRDTASAAPATVKVTVKPTTLNNQVKFSPVGPTGNGCGTNALCSGGDALFSVTASLNGVVLRNRGISFDVAQGSFQIVTPGSGSLVSSLLMNTDEQGVATIRVTANAGAPTQVATVKSTDVTSGLARSYSFNIAQVTSGVGILSVLPSAAITLTGANGAAGQDGLCPVSGRVDFYVFGGTPPYSIASPLPGFAQISPRVVSTNGGSFTAQISGCGKTSFIVSDATGRSIETSTVEGVQGAKGATGTTTPFSISPTAFSIFCGSGANVFLPGAGTFTASATSGGGSGFVVTPTAGSLPFSASLFANTGVVVSPVTVTFSSNGTSIPVTVTVIGAETGRCP